MRTVLFSTRTAGELAPLIDSSCVALLSVACKPLIVHSIESLAMARLTDVIVVVSPRADAVEAALGDGTRWGMRFEYVLATAGESENHVIERISHRLGDQYLVVRGEILRTPIIAEFVERARLTEARSVVATIGGVDAGVRWVRSGTSNCGNVLNNTPKQKLCDDEGRIEFPNARVSLLESLAAFHRSNLDVSAGHFSGLIIPGREVTPKVKVGRHTKFSLSAIKQVPLLIGSRCRIAKNAELGGEVVVSNDVVIDRRAVISASVIMPNTYVGELVEVTNAIVAGDRLIHVDTGTITTVVDSFLLANIRRANIGVRVGMLADRAIGAVLLVASFGLWPIALIAAIVANPRRPIQSRLLVGNRKRRSQSIEFKAFEFATPVPLLRYLPYLLAVLSGRMRLVGVEPLEVAKFTPTEEWESVRDEGKIGLFGPVQLTASRDTPYEQRRIIEAGYVATRSLSEDMKWMLRGVALLANRRAWYSTKPSDPSDSTTIHKAEAGKFAKDYHRGVKFERVEETILVVRPSDSERHTLAIEERVNALESA
jgi:mannose-1-phosphate guanylyltransferase / phosphomannomutase